MRTRLRSIAIVTLGTLIGCGGKVPVESEPPADGASADTASTEVGGADGAVSDGGGAPDSPPPTPATCARFVATTCSAKTSACCATAGHTWNEDACKTNLDYYCSTLVDQVTLGRVTYDERFLDACLKGWDTNLAACESDGIASAKNQIACAQLFNGKKKLGESCTGKTFVECEAPPGLGAYCEVKPGEASGKCRAYGVVGKDQPCNYFGTTVRYCDAGLYCDLATATTTCKTAKALGAACAGADDYSCGLGASCRMNKCTTLSPVGTTCAANEECASYSCIESKCAKPENGVVSAWMCNGGT